MASSTPFARVKPKRYGYAPNQVDGFVTAARAAYQGSGNMTADQVRDQSFDAVRGGYHPAQVDEMLDRLEDVFRRAERDEYIETHGQEAWGQKISEKLRTMMGRLERDDAQRFREPRNKKAISYNKADVDKLCRQLYARFSDEGSVTVEQLRSAKFRATKGRKGYEEAQVDAFIQDAVEILVVLE